MKALLVILLISIFGLAAVFYRLDRINQVPMNSFIGTDKHEYDVIDGYVGHSNYCKTCE